MTGILVEYVVEYVLSVLAGLSMKPSMRKRRSFWPVLTKRSDAVSRKKAKHHWKMSTFVTFLITLVFQHKSWRRRFLNGWHWILGHTIEGRMDLGSSGSRSSKAGRKDGQFKDYKFSHFFIFSSPDRKVNKERFDTNQCGLLLKGKIGLWQVPT